MFKSNQRGQALLIVVLVMVVALTVGLSIASKTITNLRTSTEEASSQKALAAAEAGVEQAIKTNQIGSNVASGTFTDTNTSYQTSVNSVSGSSFLMNGGNSVLQDNGADLWLSDYSSDSTKLFTTNLYSGNVTIKWGSSGNPCSDAALEIIILSGPNKQSAVSSRYTYDACASRANSNNFKQVGINQSTLLGKTFFYQTDQITIQSGFLGRVVPLYYNTPVGVVGTAAFPLQGTTITSTGTSGTTTRKVNVFQGYPEIPSEFFPYNLFSP